MGISGGKALFSKRDPDSFQDLYFEDQQSEATEAIVESKPKSFRINIFNPILEE